MGPAQREGVVGDPQAVVAEVAELLDLGEDGVEAAATDDAAEDGLRAEVAAEGTAQRDDDRRDLRPRRPQPRLLVGGVVEVAAVGQRERLQLTLAVVHGRVVDHEAVIRHEQAVIDVEGQRAERLARGALPEEVPAEAGEAHVGLAAEDRVEASRVAPGEHGGQGAAGDEQAAREALPDHLGDAQRVARQADHRRDAHDVGLVAEQVGAELLERAERAVEDPRLDRELAQLGGESGDAERREQHLGRRSGAEIGEHQGYPGQDCSSPRPTGPSDSGRPSVDSRHPALTSRRPDADYVS